MGRYALVITEKPDAARRIADALDARGNPKRLLNAGIPAYVARQDAELIVVPAIGHLYTVTADRKSGRSDYPVFKLKWAPRYAVERKSKQTRTWIEAISKLAKKAGTFIDACDYDVEGSIIGYNILKYACGGKENVAKRMKYSALTTEDLKESYSKMLPTLDFALIEAGLTRHEIDWLYGINLSRALTVAAKRYSGKYTVLSTGRVQGPALRFVALREKAIRSFVPSPYWEARAIVEVDRIKIVAQYEKAKIETRQEADVIAVACKTREGRITNIEVKRSREASPPPFDLGSLQGEAYRLFGYTPKQTLSIAQGLYLDALISYPRTGSQKLPSSINPRAILAGLSKIPTYRKLAAELLIKAELKPNEGRKEDTAHPAIYPTGKRPSRTLHGSEERVWSLIIRRFMAVFADPAQKEITRISIDIGGYCFHATGTRILDEGWLHFYKPYARLDEFALPRVSDGDCVLIDEVILESRFSTPHQRYTPRGILEKMENDGIGTKTTRADIIQTLYDRKYVKGQTMIATDLGFAILEILEEYCPSIVSTNLTRELENKMDDIQAGCEKKEKILKEAVEILRPALAKLEENDKVIGERLYGVLERSRMEERTVGPCPNCKTGRLVVIRSRSTGKRFIGCTNYFKGLCKTSFPLPQRGGIRSLGKGCPRCGWPLIQVWIRGRRPWVLCFNTRCSSEKRGNREDGVDASIGAALDDRRHELHDEAYDNVVRKYDVWKKAQEISWKEYLSEIVKNPLTGEWAREAAQHLIEVGEKEECHEESREK